MLTYFQTRSFSEATKTLTFVDEKKKDLSVWTMDSLKQGAEEKGSSHHGPEAVLPNKPQEHAEEESGAESESNDIQMKPHPVPTEKDYVEAKEKEDVDEDQSAKVVEEGREDPQEVTTPEPSTTEEVGTQMNIKQQISLLTEELSNIKDRVLSGDTRAKHKLKEIRKKISELKQMANDDIYDSKGMSKDSQKQKEHIPEKEYQGETRTEQKVQMEEEEREAGNKKVEEILAEEEKKRATRREQLYEEFHRAQRRKQTATGATGMDKSTTIK